MIRVGDLGYMGGCQNYDPFWGTLNARCRLIIGIQKGTIIDNNHPYKYLKALLDRPYRVYRFNIGIEAKRFSVVGFGLATSQFPISVTISALQRKHSISTQTHKARTKLRVVRVSGVGA